MFVLYIHIEKRKITDKLLLTHQGILLLRIFVTIIYILYKFA